MVDNSSAGPVSFKAAIPTGKVYRHDFSLWPGLAQPYIDYAVDHGIAGDDLVRMVLYGKGQHRLPVIGAGKQLVYIPHIAGHIWGAKKPKGPEPCPIMVIGQNPGSDDIRYGRCFSDKVGETLASLLDDIDERDYPSWYVTQALKTQQPELNANFKDAWLKYQAHFLYQEIALVRPNYVLLLGSKAVKAVLGSKHSLTDTEGHVIDHKIADPRRKGKFIEFKCVCAPHPLALVHEATDDTRRRIINQLSKFSGVIRDGSDRQVQRTRKSMHFEVVDDTEGLARQIERARSECSDRLISIDAEWQGNRPTSPGAYLRCIQFAWQPGEAAVVALTHPGGAPRFRWKRARICGGHIQTDWVTDNYKSVVAQMIRDMYQDRRMAGFNLIADLEQLLAIGCDLRPIYGRPDNVEDLKKNASLDAMNMAHAYNEVQGFDLTAQAVLRLPHMPRWDIPLEKHKADFVDKHRMKKSDLDGYGELDDSVLYEYGAYDADATLQLVNWYLKRLHKDVFGMDCWEAYRITHCASLAALEMSMEGLPLDLTRYMAIIESCAKVKAARLQELRRHLCWPGFNPESTFQKREALFGEKYNGKVPATHEPVRLRPETALSYLATPVLSTGKYAKVWTSIVEDDLEDRFSPATNKLAVSWLRLFEDGLPCRRWNDANQTFEETKVDASDFIKALREYNFVAQVLKLHLAPPTGVTETGELKFDKGIASYKDVDGRVRTSYSLLKETARWSSFRAPLQNLSASREQDLQLAMGEHYVAGMRTAFVAPEYEDDEPWYIISADITGAELFVTGVMSGDEQLIDHAIRNTLPEHDPRYYDIHSNVAVMAFGLKCPATKKGLKDAGFPALRTAAKRTIFGYFYGQSPAATVLQIMTEGFRVTEDDTRRLQNTFEATYPGVPAFFNDCRNRYYDGYIRTPHGRMRRCPKISDIQKVKAMQRQLMNFPIQGYVADHVSKACSDLQEERNLRNMRFRLLHTIHDAIMMLAPRSEVRIIAKELVPWCMSKKRPVYPCWLDGRRVPNAKPYYFGVDVDIYRRWGESLPTEEVDQLLAA